ncbi:hypothetical protein QR98_0088950 [Sarcoptes scabiei]|uniref:NTR domain-containing protein n=1 Tax=Sarcoptes scabiei TaxID=52283 RepID=A0A132AH66_SARSC|nr:hypothetical protein QR98_0088950 [Sarcoptes scabiei]
MILKLFFLPSIVLIVILSQGLFHQSEACSCAKPEIPLRCLADFVAIVKITREQFHARRRPRWISYNYDLLFLIYDKYFLAGFKKYRVLWTPASEEACGVHLKVGQTYVIGAKYNPYTDRLELNSCWAYVKPISEWKPKKWHIYGLMRKCLLYKDFTQGERKKTPDLSKAELAQD